MPSTSSGLLEHHPLDIDAVAAFRTDLARVCDIEDGRLLLAVSGGADSLALLLLAHAAFGGRVEAATVDHGLRPEAAAEAVFVGDVCRALGLRHAVLTGPLPERVGRTANLSTRARHLRYGLLERHRRASGCRWTATAHHADDQVETMVMRLNRGAGLSGLAGVRAATENVVRPLLGWRRADLEAIVVDAGYSPVRDPANVDGRFDRARLRTGMRDVTWLVAERWSRSAAALAEAEDALAWCARRVAADRIADRGDGVELRLVDEPPELARRLVAECLLRVRPDAGLRGAEVRDLAGRLRTVARSRLTVKATLADVLVVARADGNAVVAIFVEAPARERSRAQPEGAVEATCTTG